MRQRLSKFSAGAFAWRWTRLPELERRTREVFGVEGAYLPLNMNQNGREAPVADYRYTLCGGAYSGLVLAQAWWYTHDGALLKETYPLLKKFIRFYTETMTKDEAGTYHLFYPFFPSVPKGFTGRFENFRVRGGYKVSASMVNGKVVDFDLRGAKKGEKIEVTCPSDPDFVQLHGHGAFVPESNKTVSFLPFSA